jgi:hypothetical protein
MARPERFELPTLCFEGRCSIQLSYGRNFVASSLRWSLPLFQRGFGGNSGQYICNGCKLLFKVARTKINGNGSSAPHAAFFYRTDSLALPT